MTTTPPAPAPDREAVRRAREELRSKVEFRRQQAWRATDPFWGERDKEDETLLALADFYLARGPASTAEIEAANPISGVPVSLGALDWWRACERHHAIAAPPADAGGEGEKED